MMTVIAVDPGDAHVGVAIWRNRKVCAAEYAADMCLGKFSHLILQLDVVVVEEFRLYPGKASAQSWSPMATAEMIGAMKWIASCAGVPITLQSAAVKIPTRQQCKARGIDVK